MTTSIPDLCERLIEHASKSADGFAVTAHVGRDLMRRTASALSQQEALIEKLREGLEKAESYCGGLESLAGKERPPEVAVVFDAILPTADDVRGILSTLPDTIRDEK